MKKLLSIIGWIAGCLIILYFLLNFIWFFSNKKHLNVYILDKTVTSNDYPEHKSFVWLLNNLRYVRPDNKKYSVEEDYYGFIPVDLKNDVFDFKSIRINEVDATAAAYDAIYYTDCYGVYSFEWYKGKAKEVHTQKVYGGLNQNDFLLLKKMKESNKLIMAEYNMFSAPTNALVRSKTEALFDINWTGWTGKYFTSFNPQEHYGPPEWMPNLYESQHKEPWPIEKSGIILLNNDGLIELLITEEHLNYSKPRIISTQDGMSKYGIPATADFDQWFEVVLPGKDTEIPASYTINTTEKGLKVLEKIGIPQQFPAVVRISNSNTYYFAGDFSENPARMFTAKIQWGRWVNYSLYKYTDKSKIYFFHYFYSPLIKNILNDYYLNKSR